MVEYCSRPASSYLPSRSARSTAIRAWSSSSLSLVAPASDSFSARHSAVSSLERCSSSASSFSSLPSRSRDGASLSFFSASRSIFS